MGNLQLNVAAFSKMTLSLWFRIPGATVQKVRAAADQWEADHENEDDPIKPPLHRIVPLMTFGAPRGTYNSYFRAAENTGSWGYSQIVYISANCDITSTFLDSKTLPQRLSYSHGKEHPLDPSYIGMNVGEEDDDNPSLAFVIRYPDKPALTWFDWTQEATSNSGEQSFFNPTPTEIANCGFQMGTGWAQSPSGELYEKTAPIITIWQTQWTNLDTSYSAFDMHYGTETMGSKSSLEIEPDKWHHLLLSFDYSGEMSASGHYKDFGRGEITTNNKLWIAFDNENKTGLDLPGWIGNWKDDADANDVVSALAGAISTMSMAGAFPAEQPVRMWHPGQFLENAFHGGGGTPTYNYIPPQLPAGTLGLPATGDIINTVGVCEMAELQIWFGSTLDTGKAENRRAFVDCPRDQDGNPVIDENGESTFKPVSPAVAAELMGRRPDILLHGINNWKAGKNTGSLGMDEDGNILYQGQFAPEGTIVKYTPDPSLTQGTP